MKDKKFSKFAQLLVVVLGLLFFLQQGVVASTVRDTFKKSIPFTKGGFLSVSNSNGNIEIQSWDNQEVEIIAYKKVKANDRETAEKLMEHLKVEIRESDNEIIIETDYPKGSSGGGFFKWIFGENGGSFSVEYEIKVPKEIDLNIHTTNGGIQICPDRSIHDVEQTDLIIIPGFLPNVEPVGKA